MDNRINTTTKVPSQAKKDAPLESGPRPGRFGWGFYFRREYIPKFAELPASAVKAYVVMGTFADAARAGVIYRSIETVAEYAGLSRWGAADGIKALEGDGEKPGFASRVGFKNRARVTAVSIPRPGDVKNAFAFDAAIVETETWARLTAAAARLYLVLRAKAYDRHVAALWAPEAREWRALEFYPAFAGDVDRLLATLEADDAPGDDDDAPFRPYLPITANGRARKEYAALAGIADSNHNRRNQRFAAAVAELADAGLLAPFKYDGDALLFPVLAPLAWGR